MKISEIRAMDTPRLIEELRSLESSRFDVAMRAVTEEGEGHKLYNIRKDIARFKTILNERNKEDS